MRLPTLILTAAALVGGASLAILPARLDDTWLSRPLADDAFYYLTIAREFAATGLPLYHGAMVNGFQPLYLFLCVLMGRLTDFDLLTTPVLAAASGLVLYVVVGGASIYVLLRRISPGRNAAALGVLLWIGHTAGQRHAVNGMETGLVLAMWAVSAVILHWQLTSRTLVSSIAWGACLGVGFVARNDMAILGIVWAMVEIREVLRGGRRGLGILCVVSGTAALFALPWLFYNWFLFGSFVPQSGRAEGLYGLYNFGRVDQGLTALRAMAGNLLPWPLPLTRAPGPVRLAGSLAVILLTTFLARQAYLSGDARTRRVLTILGGAVAALCLVYAIGLGAPVMLQRWLAPCAVVGCWVYALAIDRWIVAGQRWGGLIVAVVVVSLTGARVWTVIEYRRRDMTSTFPMLEQVRRLPQAERLTVGSLQSGLLGWVYPNTLNLDGKVSPAALRAIYIGTVAEFIAQSPADIICDQTLFGIEDRPAFIAAFDTLPSPPGILLYARRR